MRIVCKSVWTRAWITLSLRYILVYLPAAPRRLCVHAMPAVTTPTRGSHPPNNRDHGFITACSNFHIPMPQLVETYNSLLTPVLARVCCANFSWTSKKECPHVPAVWRGYHWLLPDANIATLLEAMLTVPKRQRAGNHQLAWLVNLIEISDSHCW